MEFGDDFREPIGSGSLQTSDFWQVSTLAEETITIDWNGTKIVTNVSSDQITGYPTTHTVGGYTYTRGGVIYSLGTTITQYSVTRTVDSGDNGGGDTGGGTGGGQSYWYVPADYVNDGVGQIQVYWLGSKIIDGVFSNGTQEIDFGDFTYFRGTLTSSAMSQNKTYTVTRSTGIDPVDLGDAVSVADVSQTNYGVQVFNSSGNEVWGGGNRVMSLINTLRTATVTIPAGSVSGQGSIDLTEFGWSLNNRSELDVYIRNSNIDYVRTSTGLDVIVSDSYGLTFDFPRDFSFTYYVMRY